MAQGVESALQAPKLMTIAGLAARKAIGLTIARVATDVNEGVADLVIIAAAPLLVIAAVDAAAEVGHLKMDARASFVKAAASSATSRGILSETAPSIAVARWAAEASHATTTVVVAGATITTTTGDRLRGADRPIGETTAEAEVSSLRWEAVAA